MVKEFFMNNVDNYKLSLYKEVETLDKNGRVKLVINTNNKKVYVKKITDKSTGEIYQKIAFLQNRAFPKIEEVINFNDYYVIIEEYIAGKTFGEIVEEKGCLDEKTAADYIYKVCTAVNILHKKGIIHRDITQNNVILTNEGNVKIIDFNISNNLSREKEKDTAVMGTSGYAAPEQFGFLRSTERTDIYSIGVLFNYLLTGNTDVMHIDKCKCSSEVKLIIKKCTQFDPKKRFKDCNALLDSLDHLKYIKKDNAKNPKKVLILVKPFFYIFVIFELLFIFDLAHNFIKGNNIKNDIISTVFGFLVFILPFLLIGNWHNWQSIVRIDRLNKIDRVFISIAINIIIVIIAALIMPSA